MRQRGTFGHQFNHLEFKNEDLAAEQDGHVDAPVVRGVFQPNVQAQRRKVAVEDAGREGARVAGALGALAQELLAQVRKDAEAERQRIIAAAEAQADLLKKDAENQIQVELERARHDLRRATVEAAISAGCHGDAEQVLCPATGAAAHAEFRMRNGVWKLTAFVDGDR